jgi:hypothetical protein
MTRLRVLLLVFATAVALPRSSRADCPPTCLGLLCSPRSTVVSGELEPDPADASRRVLVVGGVLRSAPGHVVPKVGDQLSGWSGTSVTSGPVVGYYQGSDLSVPLGIFPVGADGNVHCRGWGESSSAPEGMGVTPVRLAELSGLPDFAECQAQLKKSGYQAPPCDDSGGLGCGLAGGGRGVTPAGLLAVSLLLLAAWLPARRGEKTGDASTP